MWRRVKEDRNQHYRDVTCFCYTQRGMVRFKEQPQTCSRECCGNARRWYGRSMQERRHDWT
jgi:hypothetical protein